MDKEAVPEVIKSAIPTPQLHLPWWKKRPAFLFLGLLILIIVAEIIWGVQVFFFSNQDTQSILQPKIANASYPQIVASADKVTFQTEEVISVNFKVVTAGNAADSVDLVVSYDNTFLEPLETNFVETGQIFDEYPVASVDKAQGIVQISGANLNSDKGFSGVGNFATLHFKAQKTGSTVVAIKFDQDSTSDSNIVLSGTAKDILSEVRNAEIMINRDLSSTPTSTQGEVCSGYFQYCQIAGKTGKQFCQSGHLKNNECVFDPKLTVSCGECQTE